MLRLDRGIPPLSKNVAAEDNPDERVRELATIDAKLLRDVAAMNPAAAACPSSPLPFSPESMTKWSCGYLPNDGGGDKRGWSLRGNILYPVLSSRARCSRGSVATCNMNRRNANILNSPAERSAQEPPAKHRFPKGFHRGVELFGQHSSRLKESGYREFIARYGLTLVEGFNDVIGLDIQGVPALGIMSNRMTDAQGEKVLRFAKQLGTRRVNLLFDCEDSGTAGAKEALWYFAEQQMDVRLVWSPSMFGGKWKGRQPESLTPDDVASLLLDS
ncbi:MAG: hypothetical protein U0936_24410 [Planctomycetaceae bacterium]